MIRVLLVDDHKLLRQGTRALLADAADIEVVAETDRGAEVLELARHHRPDIILLDIRLPDVSGVDVARTLRPELPEVNILILTAHDEEQYVRALFAIGVQGYLLKDASGQELIDAVRRVQRGEQVVSQRIVNRQLLPSALGTTLSNRELEVLALVSRGESSKEIARMLGINTRTAETHVGNILAKLGARSRMEAVAMARERRILAIEE